MANTLPIILVLILNTLGLSIYGNNCISNELLNLETEAPVLSSFLFCIGVCILLKHARIYPLYLRTPAAPLIFLYEFIVGLFLLEFALNCMWYPLETFIYTFIPEICNWVEEFTIIFGCRSTCYVTPILDNSVTLALLSYAMSITFLLTTLHITRLADMKLTRLIEKCTPVAHVCSLFSNQSNEICIHKGKRKDGNRSSSRSSSQSSVCRQRSAGKPNMKKTNARSC